MGDIAYCSPVGNVTLFDSRRDAITAFPGSSLSDWTIALNTLNTPRGSEYAGRREDMVDKARTAQTPRRPVKDKQTDLEMV